MSEGLAMCMRCGAPANVAVRGGRLVELRGMRARRIIARHGRVHRAPWYAHADPDFCRRRMPRARRRPDRFLPLWGSFIDDETRRTRRA